jgi:BirA family biotin operon repressor/biotin-[acetyl-CoA-carboxylase] ligase
VTDDVPWSIVRYATVDSTQSVAAQLVARGARHRTVAIAERQTAGYGRKGDAWHDLPGASLLMTVILRPPDPKAVPPYAMLAGIAVVDAIHEATGLRAGIKWPNDVLLRGRKVAGILGDATWHGDRLIAVRLGIGVNIGGERAAFAARKLPEATSVEAECGCRVDRDAFLHTFLAAFARWEDARDAGCGDHVIATWRSSVLTCGRQVTVAHVDGRCICGVASGVTEEGDLNVTTNDGSELRLRAADVRSLRHIT